MSWGVSAAPSLLMLTPQFKAPGYSLTSSAFGFLGSAPPGTSHSVVCCKDLLLSKMVKHPPAMRETRVQSLGWEDPQEKEMATHFSTLAWKIPWMEEPW